MLACGCTMVFTMREVMLDPSAADAVSLAVQGRNVIIEQSYGPPKITKDGVTVAKAIEFSNRFENLGANLIKQVASATNDVAGDGEARQHNHKAAVYTASLGDAEVDNSSLLCGWCKLVPINVAAHALAGWPLTSNHMFPY